METTQTQTEPIICNDFFGYRRDDYNISVFSINNQKMISFFCREDDDHEGDSFTERANRKYNQNLPWTNIEFTEEQIDEQEEIGLSYQNARLIEAELSEKLLKAMLIYYTAKLEIAMMYTYDAKNDITIECYQEIIEFLKS